MVMSVRPSEYASASFQHFSPTCFDILSWNSTCDFVLLYYRSSSRVVNLLQFLSELCPFWNLEYWKYTVFHTFLLLALTYWAERSRYDKGHFRHCPGYSCFCYILLEYVLFEQKLVFQVDISSFLHFGAKSTKNNEKSPISGKIQYLLHCNIKI